MRVAFDEKLCIVYFTRGGFMSSLVAVILGLLLSGIPTKGTATNQVQPAGNSSPQVQTMQAEAADSYIRQ
jgi:hypothetical protein